MTYGIWNKLNIYKWREGDFSSTNKLTGTIYTESERINPFNLTGYTIKIKMYKRWKNSDYFGKTAGIVSASAGTWSYAVAQGEMPPSGLYLIEVELTKAGEQMSTFPEEFYIQSGPSE